MPTLHTSVQYVHLTLTLHHGSLCGSRLPQLWAKGRQVDAARHALAQVQSSFVLVKLLLKAFCERGFVLHDGDGNPLRMR
eukprot:2040037-Amphidinium_carterae.1